MIVPVALFHKTPERVRCAGSVETGSPVVAANQSLGRFIRSIARLVNVGGLTVGWIYLVDDYGTHREEVVQANRQMSLKDREYFDIHFFQLTNFSLSEPFNEKSPVDFGYYHAAKNDGNHGITDGSSRREVGPKFGSDPHDSRDAPRSNAHEKSRSCVTRRTL